jgi:hypothetical protein
LVLDALRKEIILGTSRCVGRRRKQEDRHSPGDEEGARGLASREICLLNTLVNEMCLVVRQAWLGRTSSGPGKECDVQVEESWVVSEPGNVETTLGGPKSDVLLDSKTAEKLEM